MSPSGLKFDPSIVGALSPAEIANALLEQRFATEHEFAQLHLDEIEALFRDTQPDDTGLPSTFDQSLHTSRDEALDFFCYLLFALEQNSSYAASTETLFELAGREQGTRIITHHGYKLPKSAVLPPPAVSESDPVLPEPSQSAISDASEFEGPFDPAPPIVESEKLGSATEAQPQHAPKTDPWALDEDSIAPLWGEEVATAPLPPQPELENSSADSADFAVEAVDKELSSAPAPLDLLAEFGESSQEQSLTTGEAASESVSEHAGVERDLSPLPPPPSLQSPDKIEPEKAVTVQPAAQDLEVWESETSEESPQASARNAEASIAVQAVSDATAAADIKKVDLELEDNSWIEKQFAGIANQLATDTPTDFELPNFEEPETFENNEANTASITFTSQSSGETKEIALAVAEEFAAESEAPPSQSTTTTERDSQALEESSERELSENTPTEKPSPASPLEAPAVENPMVRSVCAEARDYLGVAAFLESFLQNSELGFPSHHLIRLSAQSLSHATESEWAHKLGRGLERFWMDRKDAIADLLDVTASPVRLHPVIKSAVDLIADSNRGLLADDKFPHTSVVSSLQYLLSIDSFEKVKLTLMDMGVLIFFFGGDRTLGGLSLKNRLGVVGLDQELNIELAFRLTRMHRLRSRSNSIRKDFTTADLLVLSQDATRCLELLGASHSDDSALHPVQVA